jgi:hypothetical protein
VDTVALMAELTAAEQTEREHVGAQELVKNRQSVVDTLTEQLQAAIERLEEAETALANAPAIVDAAPVREKLRNADTTNAAAAAYAEFTTLSAERKDLQAKSDACSKELAELDEAKQTALANAHLAVDGLGVNEGVVELHGVPIKQASTSEQLRLCVAVAAATIPKDGIRVIRISNGSVLDSAGMAVIEQMARELDFQAWIEVVDETGKVGVVIEDGQVAANNYK